MFEITKDQFNTSKEYLNKLEVRYYLIIIIPIVTFLLALMGNPDSFEIPNHRIYASDLTISLFLVLLLIIPYFYLRVQSRKIRRQNKNLKDKLKAYFTMSLKFYLMIEIPAFVAAVFFLLKGLGYYALFFGLHFIIVSAERPTKNRIARHLRLRKDFKQLIMDEEPILQ